MGSLHVVVVKNVRHRICKHLVELLKDLENILALGCGGLHECVEILPHIYGVNDIFDDIYEIKTLKSMGRYIAGRWIVHEKLGTALGGIDGLNHNQNIDRLAKDTPRGVDRYVILSIYPPRSSVCSNVTILGHRLTIGIDMDRLIKALERQVIIISCRNYRDSVCCHKADGYIHIALGNDPVYLLKISEKHIYVKSFSEDVCLEC